MSSNTRKKIEARQQLYVALYEELYNDLLDVGVHVNKAQKIAHDRTEQAKDIVEAVLQELDPFYCNIRKIIPTKLIDKWWVKSEDEKEALLYQLGLNTDLPWRENEGRYVGAGGKPEEGLYVEGSERIDKGWIDSGYASWEAELEYQGEKHGGQHKHDLEKMASGK